MACGMDFGKPRLGEYTAPSPEVSPEVSPKVSHCSRNMILVSSGNGLNFISNDVFLLLQDESYNC